MEEQGIFIERILSNENMNRAYKQVKKNKGAAGFHGYARVCRTETICYAMSNARLKKFGLLSAEEYFLSNKMLS